MNEKAFVSRANWRDKDALLWTNFSVQHSPLFSVEAGQEGRARISLQYYSTLHCSIREQPICAVIASDQLFMAALLVILSVGR